MTLLDASIAYDGIDSLAVETRRVVRHQNPYLVDVDQIAHAIDCEVSYVTFDPHQVALQVSRRAGHAFPYLIEVNGADSAALRRFSVAHGIAHVVLHSGLDDFRFVDFHLPLVDYVEPGQMYREVEANNFAAALLMPEDVLTRSWRQLGDIDDIAFNFTVPSEVAAARLSALGLLAGG